MFDCQCGCGGCLCHSGEGKRCGCLIVSVGVVGVCAIVVKGSGVDGCLDCQCGCGGCVCAIVVKGRGVDV